MATQPAVVTDTQPEIDQETGKFVYMYQPRDSEGQFIGKPYRYLYTDHQDLVRQITEGKEAGDRYIHEIKTGKRAVVGDPAAPRSNYQPAAESAEETERKERETFRKIAEKEFGAPLEEVRTDIREAREMREYTLANSWALENEANGYYTCPQNGRSMAKYLTENKLAVTRKNLDLAFDALKDTLVQKPQEPPAAPADSTQQQPTRAEVKPQSTGFIPGQFQGTRPGTQAERQPLTRERFRQIDKMNRDEWVRFQRTNAKEAQAFLSMKFPAQPQQ
jgi:hypothetical protein